MNDRSLLERTRQAIQRQGLVPAGESVLVGVSGGADSVALLVLLQRLRQALGIRQLSMAHVHHGWRGAEADADAAFVVDLGQRWEIPVAVERVDAAAVAAAQRLSLEDAARRVRYAALARAAARFNARIVAVAHTRDDQAETVLMRLVRGSGLAGLAGMTPARPLGGLRLVRPLLGVWRAEVEAFLRAEGIAVRQDSSNTDRTFLRNRIRHELLPLLERAYNPAVKDALARWADEAQADYAYLAQAADTAWEAASEAAPTMGDGVALQLAWLNRAPLALQRQLVRTAVARVKGDLLHIDFRHWTEVNALLTERPVGARVDLPGGVQVTKHARCLVVARTTPPSDTTAHETVETATQKGPAAP